MTERVDRLLADLTLDERISLLTGDGMWWTTGVDRLGIGRLKMTDGPNGARGDGTSGTTSTCFPAGVALGATWDVDLVGRIGAALAEEARGKGARLLLGPTVNLQRHPITGRAFECYSEDPLLSARLAVAWVRSLQAGGVGACVKHYVGNDQELERQTIDAVISDRALRELYLVPFEHVVADADPWAVMTSYNRVNGVYASSHRALLDGVLRGEWRWDGCVVSDWGAALETVDNAVGGLDLEMPGPTRTRGARLRAAVDAGDVAPDVVAERARNVLGLVERAGVLDDPTEPAEVSLDPPGHRSLAFDAAVAGTVLLSNDGALPLADLSAGRLAVVGPNAVPGRIQGGGSSIVFPHRTVDLLAALAAVRPDLEVTHAEGCRNDRYVPLPDTVWLTTVDGAPGLLAEWVDGPDPAGEPAAALVVDRPLLTFTATPPDAVHPFAHSVRFTGMLTVDSDGDYQLGVTAAGPARLRLDGEIVVDNWDDRRPGDTYFAYGSAERRATVALAAGEARELVVEYAREPESPVGGVRVGVCAVPDEGRLIAEAVAAAGRADAAVVVVGLTADWESEGFDRPSFGLPGRQDELVRSVAAVNDRTVVVVNAGTPVAMPWVGEVSAVLQPWYAGQEQAPAIAAILLGDVEPGGRLPLTVPERIEDAPAFDHYPGAGGRAAYGEDLLMGYRWYDRTGTVPLFAFGHGLGYTAWEWGELHATGSGGSVAVTVELRNVGDRAGAEVVQVYRRWPDEPDETRPVRELVGFARVDARAGESATARVVLDERAFRMWEDGAWVVRPATAVLEAGPSSVDLRAAVEWRPARVSRG